MEKSSRALDREDYPYCISCDQKMSVISIFDLIVTYSCVCGEVVEVLLYDEWGKEIERLLPDSRS